MLYTITLYIFWIDILCIMIHDHNRYYAILFVTMSFICYTLCISLFFICHFIQSLCCNYFSTLSLRYWSFWIWIFFSYFWIQSDLFLCSSPALNLSSYVPTLHPLLTLAISSPVLTLSSPVRTYRVLCPINLFWLERYRPFHCRDLFNRHHMYDMGCKCKYERTNFCAIMNTSSYIDM